MNIHEYIEYIYIYINTTRTLIPSLPSIVDELRAETKSLKNVSKNLKRFQIIFSKFQQYLIRYIFSADFSYTVTLTPY